MKWINRLLHIEAGEGGMVLILGLLLMGNALALQIAGIVAISGFLNTGGVNAVLLVLGVDYFIVLLAGGAQSLVVDKFNRVKLMIWMNLGFALVFILFRLMFLADAPDWLSYALMFLAAEQQFIFFPLVFWVLANDIFSMAQTKRLFPVISAWNFAGLLIGTGIAAVSPALVLRLGLPLEDILWVNAGVYLAGCGILILWGKKLKLRQTTHKQQTLRETLSEGRDFVREVASYRFLVIALVALAVGDTIIEFRFLVLTDAAFVDQGSYQQFYSLYVLAVTLLSFIVQSFLTSRIIKRMELKNVFFFFPAAVLAGALLMVLLPGISVGIAAMFLVKLVRDTVAESSLKSYQGLVPEERRGRVSTFMGSYLPAVGTILACAATGIIVLAASASGRDLHLVYLAVALLAGGVAVWAVIKMRAVYDSSLLNWRLKRRQRMRSDVLDKLKF